MVSILYVIILMIVSPTSWHNVVFVSAAELIEKSMEHDGLTRWFLEYKPDNYISNGPVVILLHGGTGSMRELFDRGRSASRRWLDLSNDNKFLLIAPNGVNVESGDTYGDEQTWSDLRLLNNPNTTMTINDDVGYLVKLVQYCITEQQVNPSKVYITGASNGGLMTYAMLIKQPNLFAAGAAFIANIPDVTIEIPNQTTPLMIMNGNKDRLVKYNGGDLPYPVTGTLRSSIETRDFWISINHASETNAIKSTIPNRNIFDRCRIRSEFYPASLNTTIVTSNNSTSTSAPVHYYLMDGGGHSVPSRRGSLNIFMQLYDLFIGGPSCHDVYGADLAWTFLSSYTYYE